MNHFLTNIKIKIPEKEIFARLGYKKNKTEIDDKNFYLIQTLIDEALVLIEPKGVYQYLDILDHKDNTILFSHNFTIQSNQISKLLQDSQKAVLLAGTIGFALGEQVQEYLQSKELTKGTILDAIGSEMADEVANHITHIIKNEVFLKNQTTTFRYSPGYGDWILSAQGKILQILEANKIHLSVNKSHILQPEKSVTAILGVINSNKKNYCTTC